MQGDEPYNIDVVADALEAAVLPAAERSFNQSIIYGKDVDVAAVLGAAKQFLWSMAVDPPCGYKRPSQSTLHRYYMSLRVVIGCRSWRPVRPA